jgi:hypothetical protein
MLSGYVLLEYLLMGLVLEEYWNHFGWLALCDLAANPAHPDHHGAFRLSAGPNDHLPIEMPLALGAIP